MHGPIKSVYQKIRGNRIVQIRFNAGMETGLSVIRSSPHCREVQVDQDQVTVELETDDQGVADLLNQLMANQVQIRSFNDTDPTLEDVFMRVTKGLVT